RSRHGRHRDRPAAAALLSRGLRQPAGRMIGVELLDDPRADPALVRRALADIARTNRLFGGTHAVTATLERHFLTAPCRPWTLLDVGTGQGDIPIAAAQAARPHGIDLHLVRAGRPPPPPDPPAARPPRAPPPGRPRRAPPRARRGAGRRRRAALRVQVGG